LRAARGVVPAAVARAAEAAAAAEEEEEDGDVEMLLGLVALPPPPPPPPPPPTAWPPCAEALLMLMLPLVATPPCLPGAVPPAPPLVSPPFLSQRSEAPDACGDIAGARPVLLPVSLCIPALVPPPPAAPRDPTELCWPPPWEWEEAKEEGAEPPPPAATSDDCAAPFPEDEGSFPTGVARLISHVLPSITSCADESPPSRANTSSLPLGEKETWTNPKPRDFLVEGSRITDDSLTSPNCAKKSRSDSAGGRGQRETHARGELKCVGFF
jgi:hypothetical protein